VPTPKEQISVQDPSCDLPPELVVFGCSEAMQAIRQTIQKVASSSAPVLITGETGAGKEVVARQIHLLSPWRDWPFGKVNCPILRVAPEENDPLRDSMIPVGCSSSAKAAEGLPPPRATLFLDEIALLDPALQVRLLEKLQDGPLLRVGLPEDKPLELRVICATSRQLEHESRAGIFLRELYDAIKVVVIELPPLRQRRVDIPQLASYFLEHYSRKLQTAVPPPPPKLMRLMSDYHWPGNIRELKNLILRYVVQGSEDAFAGELGHRLSRRSSSLTPSTGAASMKEVTRQAVQELERKIIRTVLEQYHWNRRESARALNISYRALMYKIKAAGVPPKRVFRGERQTQPQGGHPAHPDRQKPNGTAD